VGPAGVVGVGVVGLLELPQAAVIAAPAMATIPNVSLSLTTSILMRTPFPDKSRVVNQSTHPLRSERAEHNPAKQEGAKILAVPQLRRTAQSNVWIVADRLWIFRSHKRQSRLDG
jgi:hypothetical protein